MRQESTRAQSFVKAAQAILEHTGLRIVMSVLILVSISPSAGLEPYWWVFFALFALELATRSVAYALAPRRRPAELVVLALDLVATISFLPLPYITGTARLLRLVRLAALVGYWLPYVRELLNLTMRPERWRQLAFVLLTVVALCTVAAILITNLGVPLDANGNGLVEPHEQGFWSALWWAFLQIESADNVAREPQAGVGFVLSLLLTLSGFFVFSFFIGIGASLVSELVDTARLTPLQFRNHFVVLNASEDCQLLLSEIFTYYRKQLRVPRVAVLGIGTEVPEFLRTRDIRGSRYRSGSPAVPAHLSRVSVEDARRVLVLKSAEDHVTDAQVVSTVLTVREMNRHCALYAEVKRAESAAAVLVAGGARTHAILTHELQGLILANLIIFPGMRPLLEELLSSAGQEIYSCIYGEGQMSDFPPLPPAAVPSFQRLAAIASAHYGVHLIGGFAPPLPGGPVEGEPHLRHLPVGQALHGLLGIADQFGSVRDLATDLARNRLPEPPPAASAGPLLPPFLPTRAVAAFGKVLVCGFREQTSVLIEQLVRYAGALDVTLLLATHEDLAAARDHLLEASPRGLARRQVEFVADGPDVLLAYRQGLSESIGTLRLVRGDWSLRTDLAPHAFEHDVVVVSAERGAADPDARTATGILKLAAMLAECPERVPRGFRVVGEIQDDIKTRLLSRRFQELPPALRDAGVRIELVALNKLRNEFVAQSIMVPGISEVLGELLSQGGEQFARLSPSAPLAAGTITFPDVCAHVTGAGGGLPVALELAGDEGPEVVVSPRADQPGHAFDAARLRAVFVIAPLLEGPGLGR